MPSSYLVSGDVALYGLPTATSAAAIAQASTTVDVYLGRPEGLVWSPAADSSPAFMAGLTPTMSFTLSAAISAGANVVVQIVPAFATQDMVGEVLVLDRAAPTAVEACIVTAVHDPGTIVFGRVNNAHAAQAIIDQGLLIVEDRALPSKRSVARASRTPVARILSLQGRYGYGRRSDQIGGLYQEMNLVAAAQSFGGPPLWIPIDPTQASISPSTGEVWVPAGMLLAYYSEARLHYVAGYPASAIPAAVKTATAQLVANIANTSDLAGGLNRVRAGDTELQRVIASVFDTETKMMLAPYKAKIFF